MILLIEDNDMITKGLIFAFLNNDYKYISCNNISDAKKYLDKNIELIILDITLPDGNGFYFYKDFIKEKNIPTIFLTANDDEEMICKSLDLGAEDYLTKPFSVKELLIRMKKVLLRNKKQSIVKVYDISFDFDKMMVYKNNKIVALTSLEIQLLSLLFLNINKVVTRNTILDKIWEITGNDVDLHTITVYFKRIREKLDSDIIKTIKGIGYMIDEK